MTVEIQTRLRIPAARFRPSSANSLSLSLKRAQGKPGANRTRSHASEKQGRTRAYSPQVQPVIPAFPAQWFYGLYRALPGERPLLPPSLHGPYQQLDARVAAPGPHDFAVRCERFVRCKHLTPQRPSQPAPRSVTIARTSLMVARAEATHAPDLGLL